MINRSDTYTIRQTQRTLWEDAIDSVDFSEVHLYGV